MEFEPAALNGKNFSYATDLPDGLYGLRAVAYDHAGNYKTAGHTIAVDSVAPVVQISTPAVNDFVREVVAIEGSVSEPSSKMKDGHVTLHLRALDQNDNCSEFIKTVYADVDEEGNWREQMDTDGLADGRYCVTALATDKAGNDNSDGTHVKSFILDNTVPIITNLTGELPPSISGKYKFSFEALERWPAKITVALNDGITHNITPVPASGDSAIPVPQAAEEGINGPVPIDVTVDTTELPNGTNTLMVEAQDQAGNKKSLVVEFEVFNAPPPEEETPGEPGQSPVEEEEPQGFIPSEDIPPQETIEPLTVTVSNADLFDSQGAPVIDNGSEAPETQEEGQVLGSATDVGTGGGGADKVAIENTASQGLAWYWWVVIALTMLVAWLGIAAVSRRVRGVGS